MSTSQNGGEGSGDKVSKKKDSHDEDDSASDNSKKKKNNKNSKKETQEPLEEERLTVDEVSVPEGWIRKVVERKSGKTCGRHDIYFYSPEGQKFRSRTEIAGYLADTNSSLQIDEFIFNVRTTKGDDIPKKEKPSKKRKSTAAAAPSKAKKRTAEDRSTVGKKSPRKFFADLNPPPNKDTVNRTTVAKKQPKRIFVKLFTSPKKRILSDFANESHGEEEEDRETGEEEEKTKPKAKSPAKKGARPSKKSPPPKAKPKGKQLKKPATRVLASPKKGKKRKGAKDAKAR